MSHSTLPPALANALVAYASEDEDEEADKQPSVAQTVTGVPATTIPVVDPQPQQKLQLQLAQLEASVEDAMDVDDDQAPILGPQLPPRPPRSPAPIAAVPALPPLELDTTSWTISVIDNVTDMYSYSDFVTNFMHRRRIASPTSMSPTRSSTPSMSNSLSQASSRQAAPRSAPSAPPSSSFAPSAVHCPLFSSFASTPIALPPPAPASEVDPALDNKIKQWAHLKHTQGQHFTDAVLRAPDAGNPAVLHKMVEMLGIDEFGSQFRPLHPRERQGVGEGGKDRAKLMKGEFVSELAKRQAEAATRAQQQRQQDQANGARATISFVRGRTGDEPSDRG